MAYIDQDRRHEKTISGAVSLAVIGVVGYGLASGLAMRIAHQKPWVIPAQIWKATPPPPVKDVPPPKRVEKSALPTPQTTPRQTPQQVPDTRLDTSNSELGQTTVLDTGGTILLPPYTPAQPPTVDHSAGVMPKGSPGTWVTTDDYPPSEVRAGIEGRTSFRLDIGTDGRPTACTVVSSSGSDNLDRTACHRLMSRARFRPALDMAGNPTASSYAGGVTWKLPVE